MHVMPAVLVGRRTSSRWSFRKRTRRRQYALKEDHLPQTLPVFGLRGTNVHLELHHPRRLVFTIGLLATCACMLSAGCGQSPTGPDGGENRVRLTVTDRVRRPIAGALVSLLDGALARTTKTTDAAGRVEFATQTATPASIRVSKDGFHTRTDTVTWFQADGFAYNEFWLDALERPLGLEPGNYTLTISIDLTTARPWMVQAPCAGFPVELASRTYQATIEPTSSASSNYNLIVSAANPTLAWPVLFGFGVAGEFVGFEWDDPLMEGLPAFRSVRIGGVAPTTEPAVSDGVSVSIPFHGSFEYCQTKNGHNNSCWHEPAEKIVAFHSCSSDQARMVFTRR